MFISWDDIEIIIYQDIFLEGVRRSSSVALPASTEIIS
jgi:hypothetical protein